MLTLTLCIAILYGSGVITVWRRAGIGRGVRTSQALCFFAAIVVLLVAGSPWMDHLSDALFSAHMSQHLLLGIVAPPLLVFGAPQLAIAWLLPLSARVAVAERVGSGAGLLGAWRALTNPFVATLLHGVAIWMWHAPRLYELALANESVHVLEHMSFIATATLLWWSIIHPAGTRRKGYAVGMLTLFITALHTGALGALFTLSHRVWYPSHIVSASKFGTTALEDQQLAGLIMWVVGGLLYIVAMSALFVAWIKATSRRAAISQKLLASCAAVIVTTGACHRDASPDAAPDTLRMNEQAHASASAERGRQSMERSGCGACHHITGVPNAIGKTGPSLDGFGKRILVAGILVNDSANVARWLIDPPSISPGTAMPRMGLDPRTAADMAAYLRLLR